MPNVSLASLAAKVLLGCALIAPTLFAKLNVVDDSPSVQFALSQLEPAIADAGLSQTVNLAIDESLGEQSFVINGSPDVIEVFGSDPIGLMYGGLALAEQIRHGHDITNLAIEKSPFIKRRGLKMNIPLDARCPSYDDSGTSARMNVEQVWSMDFWRGFLDRMAEHRYNTLTLWSNHPFSAMVKLDKYPDVALDDVAVPTYELDDHILPQYMQGQLQNPKNYKIVKEMPIEEKIEFWREVMSYAKDRGIDIYFITWNIWVHGAEGKYGIDTSQTNPKTRDYMRESVKEFVLTYPDLKGIGITCGEHMQNKLEGENSVENWMWNTYGKGIMDAKQEDPDREVHFIHRVWYSGMDVMVDDFISKYPDPIDLGFKYARARLYSIPNPPFYKEQLQSDAEEYDLATWMNLRNDDIFHFRWGDPDYVREYMKNMPPEPLMAGYHMGSDGYVWGREFIDKDPQSPRQLEIDKHWYRFMLWGRLGYDPSLGRAFFEAELQDRFPGVDSSLLYSTWQTASKIIPLVNVAHWRDWDHMWSVEACTSKKEGYHSVDHFIEFGPLKGQGIQSIKEFVRNPSGDSRNPMTVAAELDYLAERTLSNVAKLQEESSAKEFQKTLKDFESMAYLAQYYADKFRGSTKVHRYRVNGEEKDQQAAIAHLEDALDHWKAYASLVSSLYEEQLLARTSWTDWDGALTDYAEADIEMSRSAKPGEFPESVLHSRIKKFSSSH
ncbi:MAG: hypothetical protein AAFX93_16295 [Verrucomicrobiota bacterium]